MPKPRAPQGILMSAPMVLALLAGTKTQTRRALDPQPYDFITEGKRRWNASGCVGGRICISDRDLLDLHHKPRAGDRLWVRETYYQRGHWAPVETQRTKAGRQKWAFIPADDVILFEAPGEFRKGRHHKDPATVAWHKRLGRFMPRRYSRLTLIVTDVRVERLQDISEADAIAEGCSPDDRSLNPNYIGPAEALYEQLWNSINGPGSWEANPWVVAISFIVRKGNIDG